MSHEVKIHEAQTSILRELLFRPVAGFAELRKPTGLTSDHFTFHIGRLVELGFVEKADSGKYRLTVSGKEYANRLDTDHNTIERQPKAAVMLAIEREQRGRVERLLQQRLKHPYYGFWGVPTGKIRWGETVPEAAARELLEETGLEADHRVAGVYHQLVYQEGTNDMLEDKIFFVVHCTNVRGELAEVFEGGRNEWMTAAQVSELVHVFGGEDQVFEIVEAPVISIREVNEYVSPEHF